jgi:hypothetical protein
LDILALAGSHFLLLQLGKVEVLVVAEATATISTLLYWLFLVSRIKTAWSPLGTWESEITIAKKSKHDWSGQLSGFNEHPFLSL